MKKTTKSQSTVKAPKKAVQKPAPVVKTEAVNEPVKYEGFGKGIIARKKLRAHVFKTEGRKITLAEAGELLK